MEKLEYLSITLPSELKEELRREARRCHRSMVKQANLFIELGIKANKDALDDKPLDEH